MRIEKYSDTTNLLGTRNRCWSIIDTDGTLYHAGRFDFARDLPPVEWVSRYSTNRELRPGSKKFTRIMAECLASEEKPLRRRHDVTEKLEQLADV